MHDTENPATILELIFFCILLGQDTKAIALAS